jgi:hypothetical protein
LKNKPFCLGEIESHNHPEEKYFTPGCGFRRKKYRNKEIEGRIPRKVSQR